MQDYEYLLLTLDNIKGIGKKTLNLLSNKVLGSLNWIEYREMNKGAEAFKQIHEGTCSTPKIILIP